MVSLVWLFLIISSIVYAFFSGNLEVLNNSIMTTGKASLDLMLNLFPMIVFWCGILKIAEEAGLLDMFAKFLRPFLSKLFPKLPSDHKALGYISSNIAANMLGLGSAATPFGLKAMRELAKENKGSDKASDEMITFLVLNTAGVTIVPTTIISMRALYGSAFPSRIFVFAVLSTFCSSFAGLLIDYLIRRKSR